MFIHIKTYFLIFPLLIFLLAISISNPAIALTIDTFHFLGTGVCQDCNSIRGKEAGSIEWEVNAGKAFFSITPESTNHHVVGFAFNTANQNTTPKLGPIPPKLPYDIEDAQLTLSIENAPSAIIRLDGVDDYDWDMYNFSIPELNITIDNVPNFATESDFAISNWLMQKTFGIAAEFGVALASKSGAFIGWAYTGGIFTPKTNPIPATISEPGSALILCLGLLGIGLTRLKHPG